MGQSYSAYRRGLQSRSNMSDPRDTQSNHSDSTEEYIDPSLSGEDRIVRRERLLRRMVFGDDLDDDDDNGPDPLNDSVDVMDDNSDDASLLSDRNELVNVLQYLIRR